MMTLLTVNRAQDQELSSIVLLVRMFMKEFLRDHLYSCHAPSLHPGRGRHSKTIAGPKRALGLAT
ncbi:hypothetical protein KY289_008585 [Solanum tuberosum]|nr:hypothetical protein KY289_008585 [Solanum tuberosum]